MTTLRKAAQQALEALYQAREHVTVHTDGTWQQVENDCHAAIAALRAALAQEQTEPDAYGYASRLAAAIWEKHYKNTAPDWTPLDDLIGVLTQIDNMTAGLTRQGQEQAEPVTGIIESKIKVDSHQTLDDAMQRPRAMAQAYESGYKAGQTHEREACAKVCYDKANETFSGHCQVWGDYFARAIRARSNT